MKHAGPACGSMRVERQGAAAIIVIDNVRRRNALDAPMCRQLKDVVVGLDADDDVALIVLRGAGEDFSAGADITAVADVLYDPRDGDLFSAASEALSGCRTPTLAAVRGICMGGGWQLASACDIALAADDVRIAITPARLGILYPESGLTRLSERVGRDRASYLVFTGAEVDAVRAEAWGLVTMIVPSPRFEEAASQVAEPVIRNSRFSVDAMKRHISASLEPSTWATDWSSVPGHPDFASGRRAFDEKRPPEFIWRWH